MAADDPIEERCPKCDRLMERVEIDGHQSWACPVDYYAYAVDQEWANEMDE